MPFERSHLGRPGPWNAVVRGAVTRLGVACLFALLLAQAARAQDSVDLRPLLGPVRGQGERGTCSVFAASSLMEYLVRCRTGSPIDLSEAHAYWVAKNFTLGSDFLRDAYAHMDGLAGFLAVEAYRFASVAESDWPYETRNWQQVGDPRCAVDGGRPRTECFTGVPPRAARILPYRIKPVYVERTRMGEFLLSRRLPIVFNVAWYLDAVDHRTGALRVPTAREARTRSGHVILLVGFDRRSRRFVFRNSWGPDWGDGGYGTVPERYLEDHCEVAPQLARVERLAPEERAFVERASMGVSGDLVTVDTPVP